MATSLVRISAPDRKRQILAIATSLFARQGFAGTTTRQIANQADVNEALIFRHFPSKEDLYWAVLEAKIQEAAPAKRIQEAVASGAFSSSHLAPPSLPRSWRRGKAASDHHSS